MPFLLMPTVASAATLWKGDFETGNLSQWSKLQSVSSDRLMVVRDVVREGRYALKVTVKKGDNPIRASGNRNELVYLSRETPGAEYFYKWSTLFPSNYPSSPRWQVFAQWHQDGCCGSPPLEFYVVGEEMRLRVGGNSGKVVWRMPLVRGTWHDFVMRVKWSSDAKVGFVEMYKDGKLVLPKTMAATQFGREKNYLKLGLYRDASITQVGVVYHDGFIMGTKLEDVMPPPPAPLVAQPAPVPASPPVAEQVPVTQVEPQAPTSPMPEPVAEVNEPAPVEKQADYAALPEDPEGPPGDVDLSQVEGCGASASGGMPLVAAVALLGMALLTQRRHALARARSRSRR
ncbi:MAG TPA: polysaccharide lyase [Myxococcaceae bacterium]